MTSFRIRPRFQIESQQTIEELKQKIKQRLVSHENDCWGKLVAGHIVLSIPSAERHYWSPQLSLSLEELEDEEGTLIRGLYGPSPNVWTLFTFSYATIGILIMFISIIGFSQKNLGHPAPILWVLPVLIGTAVFLYILSQIGQKVGVEQTFTIHHFFEEAIGEKVHIT